MGSPLTSRPLDLVYFIYFLVHSLAAILVDFQIFYPANVVPAPLRHLVLTYVKLSNDPFMAGALGIGNNQGITWFKTFMGMELFFQLPVCALGMRSLWKGSRHIYVLLLVYGASTFTTTLPCITTFLATPITASGSQSPSDTVHTLSPEQLVIILAAYLPWFLIPLIMTLDMFARVNRLVEEGLMSLQKVKRK